MTCADEVLSPEYRRNMSPSPSFGPPTREKIPMNSQTVQSNFLDSFEFFTKIPNHPEQNNQRYQLIQRWNTYFTPPSKDPVRRYQARQYLPSKEKARARTMLKKQYEEKETFPDGLTWESLAMRHISLHCAQEASKWAVRRAQASRDNVDRFSELPFEILNRIWVYLNLPVTSICAGVLCKRFYIVHCGFYGIGRLPLGFGSGPNDTAAGEEYGPLSQLLCVLVALHFGVWFGNCSATLAFIPPRPFISMIRTT